MREHLSFPDHFPSYPQTYTVINKLNSNISPRRRIDNNFKEIEI